MGQSNSHTVLPSSSTDRTSTTSSAEAGNGKWQSLSDTPITSEDELSTTPLTLESKRKRSRPISEEGNADDGFPEAVVDCHKQEPALKRQCLVHVQPPPMAYPKSLYDGWQPPISPSSEKLALDALASANKEPYQIIKLTDFTIYRPNKGFHPHSMASLNELMTRTGDSSYLMDGMLESDAKRHWVQAVEFSILAIDGYGTDAVSIAKDTCIQSPLARDVNVWYQLASPSQQYQRFHTPFLWLVDFTKHFVNFLLTHNNVCLEDFRIRFYQWLSASYDSQETFHRWHAAYGSAKTDFREVVTVNFEFLWKEATDIDHARNRAHFLWKEVDVKNLSAVKQQPSIEKATVVSPFVYSCFKDMYFGSCLESRTPTEGVHIARTQRKADLGLTSNPEDRTSSELVALFPDLYVDHLVQNVHEGDIVGIERDEVSKWQDSADFWYAYVQKVEKRKNKEILKVIWLYRPEDTTCAQMFYPYRNEMFFSDHCNCKDDDTMTIYAQDVRHKLRVKLFASNKDIAAGPFIRQKYITHEDSLVYGSFRTMHQSDLLCEHYSQDPKYNSEITKCMHPSNSTVLIHSEKDNVLEPVIIVEYGASNTVLVRKLLRRQRDLQDEHARRNELVYTTETYLVDIERIDRVCHIRAYSSEEIANQRVPPPYSYDGVADCWILSGILEIIGRNRSIVPICCSLSMSEGFDPRDRSSCKPLCGLGLFCGSGNFDRGLAEAGAVDYRYAVDWNQNAIHAYRANMDPGNPTNLFYGSVVDFFAGILRGTSNKNVPSVGEVEMISSGSTCTGFSPLQQAKASQQSCINSSMVASTLAIIDVLSPKYGIFENVLGIGLSLGDDKGQNVLAQLTCCLVAMGYQVQHMNLDAWSFGSPQSRSRLFISFAAPGLSPMPPPPHTHSHPPGIKTRSTGKLSNGVKFGSRQYMPTPFSFLNARDATQDLPVLYDAAVNTCIPFPDHRVSYHPTLRGPRTILDGTGQPRRLPNGEILIKPASYEKLIPRHVPRFPRGLSLAKVSAKDKATHKLLDLCLNRSANKLWASPNNKAYTRILPHHVFPTIITRASPSCAINGQWLHWDEHRIVTVMEARRAQSYPDSEVLIGLPADRWKSVGNGVARSVAVAQGLSLRYALLANEQMKRKQQKQQKQLVAALEHVAERSIATRDNETHHPALDVRDYTATSSGLHWSVVVSISSFDSLPTVVQTEGRFIDNRSSKLSIARTLDDQAQQSSEKMASTEKMQDLNSEKDKASHVRSSANLPLQEIGQVLDSTPTHHKKTPRRSEVLTPMPAPASKTTLTHLRDPVQKPSLAAHSSHVMVRPKHVIVVDDDSDGCIALDS